MAIQEFHGQRHVAHEIYDKFVKSGSDEEVNLPATMVTKISKDLGDQNYDSLYDQAEDEIVALLARDKLPRFLANPDVKKKLEDLERGSNLVTAQITMKFPFRKPKLTAQAPAPASARAPRPEYCGRRSWWSSRTS